MFGVGDRKEGECDRKPVTLLVQGKQDTTKQRTQQDTRHEQPKTGQAGKAKRRVLHGFAVEVNEWREPGYRQASR